MDSKNLPEHFSANYNEARQRFIEAAIDSYCGAYINTHTDGGPRGEIPCTDVARFGSDDASKLLIVTSGTHGVEGFAGSAIQRHALTTGLLSPLPPDMAVVFVHAVNPYGFAHLRRTNENNVDLNRNFIDWDQPPPAEHPLSKEVQDALLSTETWGEWPTKDIKKFVAAHGFPTLQAAITQGNYSTPEGLFYGGKEPEWSNLVWHGILSAHITEKTRHVGHIDIHTGLGPYGHGELITCVPSADPIFKRAQQWWGGETVKSPVDGTSSATNLNGFMNLAFNKVAKNSIYTTTSLEFGTLPPMTVLEGLAMENWVHAKGITDSSVVAEAKRKILDSFRPDEDKWKRMVIERGADVLLQAKRGLELS